MLLLNGKDNSFLAMFLLYCVAVMERWAQCSLASRASAWVLHAGELHALTWHSHAHRHHHGEHVHLGLLTGGGSLPGCCLLLHLHLEHDELLLVLLDGLLLHVDDLLLLQLLLLWGKTRAIWGLHAHHAAWLLHLHRNHQLLLLQHLLLVGGHHELGLLS